MEQTEKTSPQAPPADLVRPLEGRVIAGVAKGLADRYDLPLWVPRALFVVFAFFGGFGLALYGAGWLLIRSEGEPDSVAAQLLSETSSIRSWVGIGLIALAAVVLLDNFTFFDSGMLLAVGLLVVGVLLYTGHLSAEGDGDTRPVPPDDPTQGSPPEVLTEDPPKGGGEPPAVEPGVPEPSPSPPPPRERSILGRLTIGAMLLGAGILAVLDNIPTLRVDASPRHYLALAVTILGLGLIVGAFIGRARWLILVAALLVPVLVFSPVFEYDWVSDGFEAYVAPESFAELEDTYAIEVGSLVIDLTRLPWDGETVELTARADAGSIEIFLPEGLGIEGLATVDVGRVGDRHRTSAGLGDPSLGFRETGPLGTVVLDISVDVGNIEIRRIDR